jgi:hypothetical protein
MKWDGCGRKRKWFFFKELFSRKIREELWEPKLEKSYHREGFERDAF